MLEAWSRTRDGTRKLSANFTVAEFACKDGSDPVFVDSSLAALIAGAVTLIGVLIANSRSQAVTDTKLEELTREVREHNNFARRVPILEEQMKVANHRIADLENHERMKERN